MRIACVTTSNIPSTAANSIQVMKTCNALAQIGHEVRVWFPGEADVKWEQVASAYGLTNPFAITSNPGYPALKRYDFSWKSAVAAKRWKAEVFYTWLIPAARAGQILGMPLIIELHDRLMGRLGPFVFKQIMRHSGKKRFAIITHALRKVIEEQTGMPIKPDEAVIAPNGVDVDRFMNQPSAKQARKSLSLKDNFTAVFSGHLYAGRGIGLLTELARRVPEIQFLWVGGRAEDIAHWQNELQQKNIQNVTLTGFIDNSKLPVYLAAGDILLMPYERIITGSSGGNTAAICSPMKMFEYMAVGRAILTSDLPVIREVLNEEIACYAPAEDIDAWQAALLHLMRDQTVRERLGSAAAESAEQYSWTRRVELILSGFGT